MYGDVAWSIWLENKSWQKTVHIVLVFVIEGKSVYFYRLQVGISVILDCSFHSLGRYVILDY